MAAIKDRYTGEIIAENANMTVAQLAVEHKADLHRADLREANLVWADLREANLSGADLSGIKINWQSHALLAELLWQAAKTQAQEQLAAWVGRKTEWCWDDWAKARHPQKKWALAVLAKLAKGDADAPALLRKGGK